MSKKKQATKSEKQAVEKAPIELSDDQLDKAQGGAIASGDDQVRARTRSLVAAIAGFGM